MLAHSEVVSWVNDVVDAVTLGNQVHLEKGKEEMIISEGIKSQSLTNSIFQGANPCSQ